MSVDYKDMGKRIREIRESKHMTQAALSELAGIEPSNLSHIERAATKVSLPTLMNIANALEVSYERLFKTEASKNTDSNYALQHNTNGFFSSIASYELLNLAVDQAKKKELSFSVGNVFSSDLFYSLVSDLPFCLAPASLLKNSYSEEVKEESNTDEEYHAWQTEHTVGEFVVL